MTQKAFFRSTALTLCFSISLAAHSSHADLAAIGLGIITAPVTIPMGLIQAIKDKKAKKKEEARVAEMNRKAEEYKRAQHQDLAKFVERGCQPADLMTSEAEKIRYFADVMIVNFPGIVERDLKYYSKDTNGIALGYESKVRETFGQIDDIPAQEARKFALKKLKEMNVRYTNSKDKLMGMFNTKDLNQLSKEQRQLLSNFTCDAAQAELSKEAFYEVALSRSLAILEREKQPQQTQKSESRKLETDVYGVN